MRVVSLFGIGVLVAVVPFVTAVHIALIFKLCSSSVSIVFVIISLIIFVVVVIIPSSIISSRFTVLFAIGE